MAVAYWLTRCTKTTCKWLHFIPLSLYNYICSSGHELTNSYYIFNCYFNIRTLGKNHDLIKHTDRDSQPLQKHSSMPCNASDSMYACLSCRATVMVHAGICRFSIMLEFFSMQTLSFKVFHCLIDFGHDSKSL